MSIHYSSGKILLQNITDNNWYYLDVRINGEGLPTLHPEQVAAYDNGEVDYTIYVLIRANNSVVYRLGLRTNGDGDIDFSWTIETEFAQRPVNLFLKDSTTGLLYQVTGVLNELDNVVYINVALAGASSTTTLTVPCGCPTAVAVLSPENCLTAAGVLEDCTVIILTPIPTPVPPVSGDGILGEGGDEILGEGGESILPEDSPEGEPVEGEGGGIVEGEGSEEEILGEG